MEKNEGVEYAGSMWGFSWKRFLITLGGSIILFFFTAYVQIYDFEDWRLNLLSLSSCSTTGYPIKVCLYNSSPGLLISIGLVNIAFWFLTINFLFSFKKIMIGLGALFIWFVTVVIQKQQAMQQCLGGITWFRITGYPIAECVAKEDKDIIFAVYLVNIAFWFLVLVLVQKFLIKLRVIQ